MKKEISLFLTTGALPLVEQRSGDPGCRESREGLQTAVQPGNTRVYNSEGWQILDG
jgi:hypothetical protein